MVMNERPTAAAFYSILPPLLFFEYGTARQALLSALFSLQYVHAGKCPAKYLARVCIKEDKGRNCKLFCLFRK